MKSDPAVAPTGEDDNVCANCGAEREGRFCSQCGEKRVDHHEYAIGHFAHHALHDLTHFDTKLIRSLKPLLLKPGFLSSEYFAGRKSRYVQPLQMFVMLNILFFFFGAMAGIMDFSMKMYTTTRPLFFVVPAKPLIEAKMASTHKTPERFEAAFNEKITSQKKTLIILMVPLFAAILALLFALRRRFFLEHLIFSIHFYSFFLALMLLFSFILLALKYLGPLASGPGERHRINELFLLVPMFTAWWVYLVVATRRVYGSSRFGAMLQAVVLCVASFALFLVYRDVVFFMTLASM